MTMTMMMMTILPGCQHFLVLKASSWYSRTLDCEQLGLRVFYKTSKNFEGILT
jgi:hypothetical protein